MEHYHSAPVLITGDARLIGLALARSFFLHGIPAIIAYAAGKAALDNMTRSFTRKLAPEVKVSAIAPALIIFNPDDDEAYRPQALAKYLMKVAPGENEVVNLVNYLLESRYITGRTHGVDGGRPLT